MVRKPRDGGGGSDTGVDRRDFVKLLGSGAAVGGLGVSGITGSAGAQSSAAFGVDAGFADTSWLDSRDVTVHRVREATRAALEDAFHASGPRVVVFETSGTIDLGAEPIEITEDYCWVAGQTAPSPGITLIRGGLYVDASNCVVQHVRARPGIAGQGSGWEPDAMHTADGTTNNVFDHCTATWGIDENLSVGYDTDATTVSNCLIAEGLTDATHSKGNHSCGTLVGDGADRVTLVGNVWANNLERNPLLKYETRNVVANNVVTHFDQLLMLSTTEAAFVGNRYLNPNAPDGATVRRAGDAYFEGNVADGSGPLTDGITALSEPPLWPDGLSTMSAAEALDHGLADAGARPADRTFHDERVLDQVRNDGGAYLDDRTSVGGYPELPENTRSLSVPDSGLRAWLSEWAGRVEGAADLPAVGAAPAGDASATVTGGGADVWGTADACQFFHAPVTGDFDVAVRVDALDDTDPYAKAGLMVRESLAADAPNAFVRKTPGHGTSVQWRAVAGAPSRSTTTADGPGANGIDGGTMDATWQRLVRVDDAVLAFAAGDDRSWTRVAALRGLDLAEDVAVGLAVTSHAAGTACTAEFSGFGGPTPTTSTDVGSVSVTGDASLDGAAGPPPVGDNDAAPTDPDGDGLYEDVNGNAGGDLADAVDLYQNRQSAAVQDHADAYDFSGNERIDLADVVELYQENLD